MCLGGGAFSPRCLGGGSGHQRTRFLIISVPIGVGGRRCDVGGATGLSGRLHVSQHLIREAMKAPPTVRLCSTFQMNQEEAFLSLEK